MTEPNNKILFVDDDPNVLAAMQRNLRKQFVFETALSGNIALEILRAKGPFAVIVADMTMPLMNGVELLEAVRLESPNTVRLMLTGNADQKTAAEAVNRGNVFRFLTKPCTPEQLSATLETALKQHELVAMEKALLNQTLNGSLQVLMDIMAMLDPEAFGEAQLRRSFARELAGRAGLDSTWEVEIAALLSEIGLVTLPAEVRQKSKSRQNLTPREGQLIDRIPEYSSRLLATIPRLEAVAQMVLYQNKNFDGSGFPVDSIARAEIPLGARILRVVREMVRMRRNGLSAEEMTGVLKAGPERYDSAIVREISACASALANKPKKTESCQRNLSLAELAPGYILLSDITNAEGGVLLGVGTTLNATQLQRLRNQATLNPVNEPIAVEIPPTAQWGIRPRIDQLASPK